MKDSEIAWFGCGLGIFINAEHEFEAEGECTEVIARWLRSANRIRG